MSESNKKPKEEESAKDKLKNLAWGVGPTFFSAYLLISIVILFTMAPYAKLGLPKKISKAMIRYTVVTALELTSIFTVLNIIRRRITFEKPLEEIEKALDEIKSGHFDIQIKEQKAAHLGQLDGIIRDINLMTKELNGMETLRNDFIANISHELKAPLAVMMNYGTLLQEPGLSEEKRLEYAKGITKETRKMSSLITSILKLNRLENQQIYPNHKVYNLSEQVIECLLDFERDWERKDIEIRNEIEEDVYINADPELLSPVWENLFSNAVKYTRNGGTITARVRALDAAGKVVEPTELETLTDLDQEVSEDEAEATTRFADDSASTFTNDSTRAASSGGSINSFLRTGSTEPIGPVETPPAPSFVEVTVSDTGVGMSQKVQDHMFDKFYQGDRSHATEGNGLGMSLVQRILSIVGGTISVRSAEGEGSTFVVRIPTNL